MKVKHDDFILILIIISITSLGIGTFSRYTYGLDSWQAIGFGYIAIITYVIDVILMYTRNIWRRLI